MKFKRTHRGLPAGRVEGLPAGATLRSSDSSLRSTRRVAGAFTLVELMVVAVILGVLAGVLVRSVVGKSDKAKRSAATMNISVMEGALDEFYIDMGRYPTSEEGLRVLFHAPEDDEGEWGGPYMKKPVTDDPWKHPYSYEAPGSHSSMPYEIMSFGADGQEGGEGPDADVVSWVEIEDEE